MLANARQNRWDVFARLLQRREPALRMLAMPEMISNADDGPLFATLLELNQSISLEAASVRDSCNESLQKIHQGRRAKIAYHSTMLE